MLLAYKCRKVLPIVPECIYWRTLCLLLPWYGQAVRRLERQRAWGAALMLRRFADRVWVRRYAKVIEVLEYYEGPFIIGMHEAVEQPVSLTRVYSLLGEMSEKLERAGIYLSFGDLVRDSIEKAKRQCFLSPWRRLKGRYEERYSAAERLLG